MRAAPALPRTRAAPASERDTVCLLHCAIHWLAPAAANRHEARRAGASVLARLADVACQPKLRAEAGGAGGPLPR